VYLPASFREDRREVQFGLVRSHPLGLLITMGGSGLGANFVPFVGYPDEGEHGVLRAHVARANAQWQDLTSGIECLVVFRGPQAYIRPNWYVTKQETHKVVPTWNYATVHAWGRPQLKEDAGWLRRQIGDLTRAQEGGYPDPWQVTDAPADFVDAQLKAIIGIEIVLSRLEGKWKMSQNRNAADQQSAIEGLRGDGGAEQAAVAEIVAARAKSSAG
jgi:transcriptional regulator